MEQKIKLDLSDLRIDAFAIGGGDGGPSDGTVHAYISLDNTGIQCGCTADCTSDPSSCPWTTGSTTCDYTCGSNCETSPAPCSQNPPDGASCDATCAQVSTCVYTGPTPGCC
jgi:hypothetical protein